MKFALLFCIGVLLTTLAGAEPAKKESVPVNLPVIEIHSETPTASPGRPAAANSTYELPPIEGQKAEKMSGAGRTYWGGPYGMPAGPGRAWPSATAPGTPGAPAGGLMNPAGVPGRF
ncbi:MAG: hypothetical protein KF760_19675 [Candidatus Eremiobacteraeota bacterium]|nr:hypothetical protein [Candidatus Eremiobacteraeota bacterium]MCW5869129.1 hypothetical protein [Candidatus Eremiobacteraeota bacterium]